MFKYIGSSQIMDKRKLENRLRRIVKEDDDDFRDRLQANELFNKILESIPEDTIDLPTALGKEADKRLQIHSLRCKVCKQKEVNKRINCKTVEILINIKEGL